MKIRTCQELFLSASLMVLLGNHNLVWADQPIATDASLAQLENRFFEHPYNKDTETDRLSRLEGFIFGSAQDGTVDERLKHILATIPKEADSAQTQSTSNNTSNATASQKSVSQSAGNSDIGSLPDGSTYPRVTNLEKELLGQTYVDNSLPKRLSRLETKAFGAPSTSSDLSDRVDQLDQYADRHDLYGERKTASLPPYVQPNSIRPYTSSASGGQTQFSGSISERLAMMEAQEFGHTYPERSLEKRVKKLDEKILPADKKRLEDKPLPDQVNALWLTLHPNGTNGGIPLLGGSPGSSRGDDSYSTNTSSSQYQSTNSGSPNSDSSTETASNRPHHGWLHALAKTAGTVGKVAASSMTSYGGYPGYGYGGGGFGGYGGGGYGGYGGGYGGYPGGGYGNGTYFGAPSIYGNTLPNHY